MSLVSNLVPLLLIALLCIYAVHNRLTTQVNRFHHAFVHLGIQLKRRHGLAKELLRSPGIKLSGNHPIVEALVAANNEAARCLRLARHRPGEETAMAELTHAENTLDSALVRLAQMVEHSTELGASKEIKRLLDELGEAEKRITLMSQIFNGTVMRYNTYKHGVSRVWLANALGHRQDATPLGFDDSEMTPQAFQPAF
ncbi:LemA family protein [Pistricoccus aurantiacus]|uniref:LemA family protein n=1 Tax=Pistricoccus aurantiacus TaxID=1883414 RepID=A0A5B8ST29_9GAMM|nr:LemA family protein [Pistricoccus aurantiacus]QEA38253.1 LemA family protein [Pistricoccus aurantiacus]